MSFLYFVTINHYLVEKILSEKKEGCCDRRKAFTSDLFTFLTSTWIVMKLIPGMLLSGIVILVNT